MTTCAEDGSFTISGFEYISSAEPDHECYYAVAGTSTAEGRFYFSPAYVWNGSSAFEGPMVYRGESSNGTAWVIGYWTAEEEDPTAVCYEHDEEGDSPTHPTDVTSWECDGVSSSFDVICNPGCDGSGSPSPTDASFIPKVDSSSQSSSSPLDKAEVWVGIVSGVVGTAAILVGVVRYFWKRRSPQT
eukprot:g12875.t1